MDSLPFPARGQIQYVVQHVHRPMCIIIGTFNSTQNSPRSPRCGRIVSGCAGIRPHTASRIEYT